MIGEQVPVGVERVDNGQSLPQQQQAIQEFVDENWSASIQEEMMDPSQRAITFETTANLRRDTLGFGSEYTDSAAYFGLMIGLDISLEGVGHLIQVGASVKDAVKTVRAKYTGEEGSVLKEDPHLASYDLPVTSPVTDRLWYDIQAGIDVATTHYTHLVEGSLRTPEDASTILRSCFAAIAPEEFRTT